MPLKHSKSDKAFKQNMETEMKSGKPKDQALAIAYSVQRKAKRKMANGGEITAKTEKRPTTEATFNDTKGVNSVTEKPTDSRMDRPPENTASNRVRTTRIKHPKMAGSGVFQARLRDDEDDLIDSAKTNQGPQEQPPKTFDEERPNRKGPSIPDTERPHTMAEGGEVYADEEMRRDHEDSIVAAIMARRERQKRMESDSDEDEMAMMANGGIAEDAITQHEGDSSLEEGTVDIDDNEREIPNQYYNRNENASLKENYDEEITDMTQPMDSNKHGDPREDAESDPHDMVESIRRKMKSRKQS